MASASMCGGVAYNAGTHLCCSGKLRTNVFGTKQCCGHRAHEPSTQLCCDGRVFFVDPVSHRLATVLHRSSMTCAMYTGAGAPKQRASDVHPGVATPASTRTPTSAVLGACIRARPATLAARQKHTLTQLRSVVAVLCTPASEAATDVVHRPSMTPDAKSAAMAAW